MQKEKRLITTLWIIGMIVLLGLLTSPGVYFYLKYRQSRQSQTEMTETQLVERVGKLISLPVGEAPTIMTVADRDKLSGTQFFALAKNGDKVLLYKEAKKAYLYDPVANKILEVGPMTNSAPSPIPSPTTTPEPVLIALYNGTAKPELAATVEQSILKKIPGAEIVMRGNTTAKTYEHTTIADVTNTKAKQTQLLASLLDIAVAPLATDEAKPLGAGFLIIVGTDR